MSLEHVDGQRMVYSGWPFYLAGVWHSMTEHSKISGNLLITFPSERHFQTSTNHSCGWFCFWLLFFLWKGDSQIHVVSTWFDPVNPAPAYLLLSNSHVQTLKCQALAKAIPEPIMSPMTSSGASLRNPSPVSICHFNGSFAPRFFRAQKNLRRSQKTQDVDGLCNQLWGDKECVDEFRIIKAY